MFNINFLRELFEHIFKESLKLEKVRCLYLYVHEIIGKLYILYDLTSAEHFLGQAYNAVANTVPWFHTV